MSMFPTMNYQPSESYTSAMNLLKSRINNRGMASRLNQASNSMIGQNIREGFYDINSSRATDARKSVETRKLRSSAGAQASQSAGQNAAAAESMTNDLIGKMGELGAQETQYMMMVDAFNKQQKARKSMLPLQIFSSLLSAGAGIAGGYLAGGGSGGGGSGGGGSGGGGGFD